MLKGIPISKGTFVYNQPLGLHYSEKYYKNPREFRPERWEGECDKLPAYALVGFSGGPRSCIGKHLALLESKIGLIKLMQRYKQIELGVKEVEMAMKLTYQPRNFLSKMLRE